MAVLRPLRLVIENYPEGQVEEMEAVNNPEDPSAGSRKVPFSRVLYIEQDDFRDPAPPKYFRLSPGAEVRLRYAYIVKCTGVERDERRAGGGGALHLRPRRARRRLPRAPGEGDHPLGVRVALDPRRRCACTSTLQRAPAGRCGRLEDRAQPAVARGRARRSARADAGRRRPGLARFQFERHGYFCVDARDSTPARLVFNRTVGLRDTWAKIEKGSS